MAGVLEDDDTGEAYSAAAMSWPRITLAKAQFDAMARDVCATRDGLRTWAADFYLACAAGHAEPTAIHIVGEQMVGGLTARIRRLGCSADEIGDVLQIVRERLLTGRAPRILAYSANAPLEQWIKVVAMRTAIDVHRHNSSAPLVDAQWTALMNEPTVDTFLRVARQEHRLELEQALRDELAALPQRDKAILRLHLLEGVSIEKIAVVYGVHRVTVARWVWNAGEQVLEGIRRRFAERWSMVPIEFESLVRLLQSHLSIDLDAMLKES